MAAKIPTHLPASKLAHRALICLIPAFSLMFAAIDNGIVWIWVPALGFGAIGAYFLVEAARQLNREHPPS